MKGFLAFFKKELLEGTRSGRLPLMALLFLAFGIMNPAIAKLTPQLMEWFSEELAESGMSITVIEVDALTSWTQFFKNVPMALIVFAVVYGTTLTGEYQSGTLILVLTKGLARYKVLLAKLLHLSLLFFVGYWLCFFVTYAYNAYFWDNSIASSLFFAAFLWWLFGQFTVCLLIVFSTLCRSAAGVLLGVGATVLASTLLGMIPRLSHWVPTALMNGMNICTCLDSPEDYLGAILVTAALSLFAVIVSVPILNKKQL
jgi:ABC-2 type transport system permease protein